ncbi:MAG: DUF2304 domain-containing protein [Planctomycetes bacterium]|nr:DUF2304 domain-containing protein [Planctomycetota bacterium]
MMLALMQHFGAELEPLPGRQRIVAFALAAGLVVLIFELVRRRKLREEYSWVWIGTSVALAFLALYQDLLLTLSRWIGSASVVSTLFFGAFLFVLALLLQFSVRLSRLTLRHRTLGQRVALLEEELQRLRDRAEGKAPRERAADRDKGEVA